MLFFPLVEKPDFPAMVPVLCGEDLGRSDEGLSAFEALSWEGSVDLCVEGV